MSTLDEYRKDWHCPKCDALLTRGTAHGKDFGVQYKFCHECNELVEFHPSGLPDDKIADFKDFLLKQLRLQEVRYQNQEHKK